MSRLSLDTIRVERRDIGEQVFVLLLPELPPSTNNLYDNVSRGGRVKSSAYKNWLDTMGLFANRQIRGCFSDPVTISIEVEDRHPRRDASNVIKPCEDLLVKSGVIIDDRAKYVRKISAEWADVEGVKISVRRAA